MFSIEIISSQVAFKSRYSAEASAWQD